MAKNEPNQPEGVKTDPVSETPAEEKAAPVIEPPEVVGNATGLGAGCRRSGGVGT